MSKLCITESYNSISSNAKQGRHSKSIRIRAISHPLSFLRHICLKYTEPAVSKTHEYYAKSLCIQDTQVCRRERVEKRVLFWKLAHVNFHNLKSMLSNSATEWPLAGHGQVKKDNGWGVGSIGHTWNWDLMNVPQLLWWRKGTEKSQDTVEDTSNMWNYLRR